MSKVYFLLGVHNHQPVGNFDHILEEAYNKSYKPFLDLLYKYPEIKFSLHCSGILWDYFLDKHKEYIEQLKEMVKRGQVELISGGYYEPILPSIPVNDRIGQIKKMNEFIYKTFNFVPQGIWLTERVWEQSVVKDIADCGIKYTIVDDYHFFSAGIPKQELTGYYVTDEEGRILYIFPTSQTLRYYIPFRPVEDVIKFFSQFSNGPEDEIVSLTMGDDGEKFGVWPKTYEHVYQNKWLKNFLDSLKNNQSWLFTTTFSEFLLLQPPKGRVYLPTSSYFEMGEWTLPQPVQEMFEDIIKEISQRDGKEKYLQFLRGGYWKNFFAKYSESNHMHKKMLYVSKKVEKYLKRNKKFSPEIVDNLYKSQCNCAYWHGVFGGLYLPHLRDGVYEHLIKTEKLIYEKDIITLTDFDMDGRDEIIVETKFLNLYINPSYGGSITEIDIKKYDKNITNILTRRKEAYHRRLVELSKQLGEIESSKVKTIHDLLLAKEPGLEKYLFYDWFTRYSFLDHFLHPNTKYIDFYKCQYGELGDFVIEPYNVKKIDKKNFVIYLARQGHVWQEQKWLPVNVYKEIKVLEDSIQCKYVIKNSSVQKIFLWFLSEINLMISRPEENLIGELNTKIWQSKDTIKNFDIEITVPEETSFWVFPIETVSLSEAGFERTYQGVCVSPNFKFELSEHGKFETEIVLTIK